MAVDPRTGNLFFLDSPTLQIIQVIPDINGNINRAQVIKGGAISGTKLSKTGIVSLALKPDNGNLYLLNSTKQKVYELTSNGQLVSTIDISRDRVYRTPKPALWPVVIQRMQPRSTIYTLRILAQYWVES